MKIIAWIVLGWLLLANATLASENLQPITRDDLAFAALWKTLRNCDPLPAVKNGQTTSDYLNQRGYVVFKESDDGYVTFPVDERLYGLRVTSLLLPTTWSILAITVEAPVELVKSKIEKAQGIRFASAEGRHFKRKLNSNPKFGEAATFDLLPSKDDPKSTVISCDLDQQ